MTLYFSGKFLFLILLFHSRWPRSLQTKIILIEVPASRKINATESSLCFRKNDCRSSERGCQSLELWIRIKKSSNSYKIDIQSYGRVRLGVTSAFGSDWVDIRTRLNLALWAKWNL